MKREWFWNRADRSGGVDACWPWMGPRDKKTGYGSACVEGRAMGAHRWAYTMAHGEIPRRGPWTLSVLHACDNPPCVNPAHLRLGTASDNSRDAVAKGRWGNRYLARKRNLDDARGRLRAAGVDLATVTADDLAREVRDERWRRLYGSVEAALARTVDATPAPRKPRARKVAR